MILYFVVYKPNNSSQEWKGDPFNGNVESRIDFWNLIEKMIVLLSDRTVHVHLKFTGFIL